MAFHLNDDRYPLVSTVLVYDKPRTVLYVEDNADNMQLVERILTRHPRLTFLAATNGTAGIQLAREHRPDVILMDINMPVMGGLAVLEVLLGDPETAHIPVLALSSGAYPKQIEMGIKAGFFGYMTKPFRIEELEAAVALAIAHSTAKKFSHPSLPVVD
ncbi:MULTISPECIES: response regulator [unclassified Duganella]|uniref:response regulator n=1 Tax=unclassified Duganella TaxID=2636909 RepID=UPI00087449F6|nr:MULTISPECIES: response regulator [unclassified Duganella]OEZ63882.1 polar-differentiation response regulator DivK [Duganella sp. HH105]OFA06965.1 polar-differentiation response regulator DivK [Duganella sp. HH101]